MNGSNPLSQLRDIHLPASGGFWPPAPGWWLLTLLGLAALAAVMAWYWRRRRRNRWRAEAQKALRTLAQHAQATPAWFAELNTLLKRVARICHPSQQPESLSGEAWARFLLTTAPAHADISRERVEALVHSAWKQHPDIGVAEALAFARTWLEGQTC